MPELMNLNIQRVALHQVFERDQDRSIVPPRLNTRLSVLGVDGIQALKDRIIHALGRNSSSLQMSIVKADDTSCFQCMAKMIYLPDGEFLEHSKLIAQKLAEAQTSRAYPGGIIVLVSGTVGPANKKYIAAIKAESQSGFALNQSDLDLLFMDQLLLTPEQKLYKIGMFIEAQRCPDTTLSRSPDEFEAFVYDRYMTQSETRTAAMYFYEAFLGCTIHASNKKLTRDFYTHTKGFIKHLDKPDSVKIELQNALYDYLKVSRDPVISVRSFAERYFEPALIDRYTEHMANNNFPANSVSKDTELIKNKLRKRRIKFTSNVQIIAPSENFDELVRVIEQQDDAMIVRISGKIEAQ